MIDLRLDEIKRQCRVDFDEDDALLTSLGEAAEEETVRITGQTPEYLLEQGGGRWPSPLRQAMLIRTAQFYSQPEGSEKPNALFESLIRPYQKL